MKKPTILGVANKIEPNITCYYIQNPRIHNNIVSPVEVAMETETERERKKDPHTHTRTHIMHMYGPFEGLLI